MSQESKPEEIEIIDEGIIEYTSTAEYINSAVQSLVAMHELDYEMLNAMSKEDGKRVKRIIRKSLRIIDICISEMYDELFEDDSDEQ